MKPYAAGVIARVAFGLGLSACSGASGDADAGGGDSAGGSNGGTADSRVLDASRRDGGGGAPGSGGAGGAPGSGGAGAGSVPLFKHVFVVLEENRNFEDVLGPNSSFPYLKSLGDSYGAAVNYYANTHPSIGNYFMMTTGQIITNDDSFTGTVSDDNIVRRLIAAGLTWKAYEEDLPSVGYTGSDTRLYMQRHCPLSYFSDVRNDAAQRKNLVPFSQFATDLAKDSFPSYSFITPNGCNDGHDCADDVADGWLRDNIAPLIAHPRFAQDDLLLILFDEAGNDSQHGGGQIAWVAISGKSKRGYKATTFLQQESTLRLTMEALGMTGFPGKGAGATGLGEMFLR